MKINIGKSHKRYTRDMSFDNNTTFGFGDVQPLMCQYMMPDSDIRVSMKQLVRLSPLIAPSFARINLYTTARFVPMADVFPYYESFLANKPVSVGSPSSTSFRVQFLPCFKGNFALMALLKFCRVAIYKDPAASASSIVSISGPTWSNSLSSVLTGQSFSLSDYPPSDSAFSSSSPTPSSCDFFIVYKGTTGDLRYLCARIDDFRGSILRKIFVGLGYSLSPCIDKSFPSFSVLPLFAYYKAWYDTYAPQRTSDWQSTLCYRLVDYCQRTSNPDLSAGDNIITPFFNFLFKELCECYYVAEDDYISINTVNPITSASRSDAGFNNATLAVRGNSSSSISPSVSGNLPTASVDPDSWDITVLDGLRRFSKFLVKDSVLGQRISSWVSTHFNADVANQLFKDSNLAYSDSMALPISDVFSTSDTAASGGENLGAYAGKGIGYGNGSFKFHSSVHGYLIVFACVAPVSRSFQGCDPTLFALTRFSQPMPEFDALGYEITDKRSLFDTNDIVFKNVNYTSDSFGYVPRYTSYKYKKNIVNGDMSRRSTMDTLSPYYLDRYFISSFIQSNGTIVANNLPTASESWRYITKYGYLGNFNRLFINDDYSQYDPSYNINAFPFVSDNFLGQFIFDVKLTDALKPLKQSYDTFDEHHDNDTVSVNAE